MQPKTRSHNGYLPATESRETTQKLSFGPKEVDWACSLQKNKTQLRKHKVVHCMHPERDLTTGTSRQRNHAKPPRNLVLGLKKWIGQVRCEKTIRNFGSTKWCIVCTPKPDLTTGTSRQRNRAKPTRNLVLGLMKWIGQVRCEKTRSNFGSTKWCILCTPKPDLTTCTSRQQNRAKPPRNIVLGLKKWIGHVRCENEDATSEAQSGAFYAPQSPISQLVHPGNEIARNHPET